MKRVTRRVKRLQVVAKSGGRSAESLVQPAHLGGAPLDLTGVVYLSVPKLRQYLDLSSNAAVYMWAFRHKVPKCHVGRSIRFLRSDVDREVQKSRKARHAQSLNGSVLDRTGNILADKSLALGGGR